MKKLRQEKQLCCVDLVLKTSQTFYPKISNKLKFLSRYTKLWNVLYTVLLFFTSGGGVDDVLVRLSLIKQIIKDVTLMCIAFSVKHPRIFWKSWMSLFNMSRTISDMYTYPFNPQLVMKSSRKSWWETKRSKELLYVHRYFLNGWVYFSLG